MQIAICDDMKIYILSIEAYVKEFFQTRAISYEIDTFTNGLDLLNSQKKYDIVFLDIELEDLNGIEVAKQIQLKNRSTIIIVVTSYRKYLDDAMDLKVTRYIDKPISQDRIIAALKKATEELLQQSITFTTTDKSMIRIRLSDIVYAEATFKKVKLYTVINEFELKESLKSIREKLSFSQFATPHNSYIINLNYILDFHKDYLVLTEPYNSVRISVAPRKRAEFKRQFMGFIGEDYI